MGVPHARSTLTRLSDIPFNHDGTRGGTLGHDDKVAHLDGAGLALLSDLESGDGVVLVGELAAVSHDHGPDLTGDLDILGNLDGIGDDVGTVVEVDDLVGGSAVKDLLDDLGVVNDTVPVLFSDNLSALHLTVKPILHARSKHIELDFHYVRERVARNLLVTEFVSSSDQLADILTKNKQVYISDSQTSVKLWADSN